MSMDSSTLSTLTIEQAKHLAKHEGRCLPLNGLKTLDAAVAWELARYKGNLYLDGLTDLTTEAAKALALHEGGCLSLSGLKSLTPEVASALARFKNHLLLNGLADISDFASLALSQRTCDLTLNGLITLSDTAAKALAQSVGWPLFLPRSAPLPLSASKRFRKMKGTALSLDGVDELSHEAEVMLASHSGRLSLQGLSAIHTVALARKCFIEGIGPDRLWLENVSIDGLEEVISCANRQERDEVEDADLDASCFTELTIEQASVLSTFEGTCLTLDGLREISDEVAEAIGACKCWQLRLGGLTSLTPQAADGLAAFDGWLFVGGVKTLSTPAAQALSQCKGQVFAYGLEDLSDAALAARIAEDEDGVELKALKHLSDEAAEALSKASSYISLPSLTSLTPRAAKAFSTCRGRVQLTGLQSLTDECAALLAGFAGVALDLGYPGDISTAADKALRANGRITVMDAEEAAKQNAELESLRAEIRRFQAQVPALRNKDLS